ncbi:hypothetical protein RB195_022789 [Necator americanus]
MEASDNQGIPTQYIKVLRELYSNFTTRVSPYYKNIIVDLKRGVRQGDTISPRIFTATLENAMRKLEWDDMGMKVDGGLSQAERMLTEFDETCGCIGLQPNLQNTIFTPNECITGVPIYALTERTYPNAPATVKLQRVVNLLSKLAAAYGLRLRLGKIWNSDEWIDSVQALAEDREGWAELCSRTAHLSEDAGNRVKR